MLGVISNPKKIIVIDFSLDKVKIGVDRIAKLSNKYKFTKSNPIFNQTTYEATEFASLGVYIDINLSSLADNKTEITIEIRRKIGSFDKSYEVTEANQHISNLIDIISLAIGKTDEELNVIIKNSNKTANIKVEKNKKNAKWFYSIFLIVGVAFYIYVNYVHKK